MAPLCHPHHVEQHAIGEQSFERRYGVRLLEEARATWALSPESRPGIGLEELI